MIFVFVQSQMIGLPSLRTISGAPTFGIIIFDLICALLDCI